MDEFLTACPRNCYSTCTFRVRVKNNRIVRILPFKGNMATPEGPCIKGLSYIERAHSPERIVHPLIKSPDGKFRKTELKEALDIIADKLMKIRSENGAQSVFWYKGSGMSGLTNEIAHSFWKEFGGPTITYGNLCWPAGLEAVRLTMGSVKHNVPWDIVNAKTLIIWGKNPADTNIQEIAFIARAREKGSQVIVIDPVRTASADKADIFYSPKPGTDAALALSIAYVLIKDKLVDAEFISNNVHGYKEFSDSLKLSPADAESITGIPAKSIIDLAYIIGNGGPLTFLPGYGLQRHHNGGQTIRSILALSVITGNIGKPGSGFNYANLQSYIYDDVKEPLSYYPDNKNDHPFRRTISMAKLGSDMLQTTKPDLNFAWIERGNPLLQSPDSTNVRKAFKAIGFKVVVDQFMTDTAEIADIILPAKNMFEQSDIIGSYWSPYVQFKPKILDAPEQVIPESEIYYHLAERLGFKADTSHIPEPGNENIERWLENRINGISPIRLSDLKQGPIIPQDLQQIAFEDLKFDTPSGKIELLSTEAETKWGVSPLPYYSRDNKNDELKNYPLTFMTPNAGNRIHSQFGNLKIIKDTTADAAVILSVDDANVRKIKTGDKIRLFNQHGSIVSIARVSNRIPNGLAVLPNGIWINEGGGGNVLIQGRETDMGHGSAFHDNRIEVELVE